MKDETTPSKAVLFGLSFPAIIVIGVLFVALYTKTK